MVVDEAVCGVVDSDNSSTSFVDILLKPLVSSSLIPPGAKVVLWIVTRWVGYVVDSVDEFSVLSTKESL